MYMYVHNVYTVCITKKNSTEIYTYNKRHVSPKLVDKTENSGHPINCPIIGGASSGLGSPLYGSYTCIYVYMLNKESMIHVRLYCFYGQMPWKLVIYTLTRYSESNH